MAISVQLSLFGKIFQHALFQGQIAPVGQLFEYGSVKHKKTTVYPAIASLRFFGKGMDVIAV